MLQLASPLRRCKVVNVAHLPGKKGISSMKSRRKINVRASISFPADIYETLEEVARQKKVSWAWVVRDAAEKYLGERRTSVSGKQSKRKILV
jgi:hypothetical protein